MRVLFTLQHFHPLVPLARALENSGHDVAFVGPVDNSPAMEQSGFTFFAAGTSMGQLMPKLIPQIQTMSAAEREQFIIGELWLKDLPESLVPSLLEHCKSWQPDVLVRDDSEFAGYIAAEALGLPHASVEIGAFRSLPFYQGEHCQRINDLRRAHRLSDDPGLESLFRYLHLAFVPPSFQDPAVPYPTTGHALCTTVFDQSGDESLPAWVAELPDQPTVYATLGLSFGRAAHVFQAILDGLRDQPYNLIMTVGRHQDPNRFGPQPPHVHIEQYIPQSLIFPHCDLVISHGGWNTVLSALSHGLPLVNIPLGADQPHNAQRCEALAVGTSINVSSLKPEALRNTVEHVLSDGAYQTSAARLRAEMESLPGVDHAVSLLEQLAHEGKPIPAK